MRVSVAGMNSLQLLRVSSPLPDRLALLTLLSSIYFFQFWAFHSEQLMLKAVHIALVLLCIVGIMVPRVPVILPINCLAFAIYYVVKSPLASNNLLTAFFFSVIVLLAVPALLLCGRRVRGPEFRDQVFAAIAGPGRWLLAAMYFFGIYHKINADFLNPEVSCAVELYRAITVDFGLNNLALGHYAAIYGTFFVEGVAMVALFSRRYKRLGMLVGIPFHILIGWTGYAFYKDFSTIVLILYILFLPREALVQAGRVCIAACRSAILAATLGWLALGSLTLLYIVLCTLTGAWSDGFTWAFSFYAGAFYLFAVIFVSGDADAAPVATKPCLLPLFLLPLLYFVNGLSPYFGLKTESSIAMYSNLQTEAGQTNHLIHGQFPLAFGYQNDVVYILNSNSKGFMAAFAHPKMALVRYEFDRILHRHPGLSVEFLHDGVRRTADDGWVNSYEASSLFERGFLLFKPIDFNRPKICTH